MMKKIIKYIVYVSSLSGLLCLNWYIPQTTPLIILLGVLVLFYQKLIIKTLINETQSNVEIIEILDKNLKDMNGVLKNHTEAIKDLRKNEERLKESIDSIKTNQKLEIKRIFGKMPSIKDV